MKSASIRDFRSQLADLIQGTDPVVVTRHGKNVAILYPMRDPEKLPVEIRRKILQSVARQFGLHENTRSESPLIERYKRDVDRTLIRENLRRTPEERLRALQVMQSFAAEIRRAGRRLRR